MSEPGQAAGSGCGETGQDENGARGCAGVPFDPKAACEQCGCFGAFAFDGKSLCAECYPLQGSCCAEREQ